MFIVRWICIPLLLLIFDTANNGV